MSELHLLLCNLRADGIPIGPDALAELLVSELGLAPDAAMECVWWLNERGYTTWDAETDLFSVNDI